MKYKLFVLLLFILVNITFAYTEELNNQVIVRVNEEAIYSDELYYELSQIEEQAIIGGEKNQIPLNFNKFEELQEQVIQTMINKRLLLQEVKRQGIFVDPTVIDQHFDYLKQQFPDEIQFREFLNYSGISELKLKNEIRSSLCIDTLSELLIQGQGTELTETTCRSYYEKNKELYKETTFEQAHQEIYQTLKNEQKLSLLAQLLTGLYREATIIRE